MEVRIRRRIVATLAVALVAVSAPAALGGPGTGLDAHERPDAAVSPFDYAQLDAHARASGGPVIGSLASYRDAAERTHIGRGIVPTASRAPDDRPANGIGFSWEYAGIGAGAAVLLVGALGLVVAMRHGRRRVAVP